MSTRCQIDFVVIDGKFEERRRIYRHSDGYPSGVVPDLQKFATWLTSGPQARSLDDIEYTAANFIYWSKKEMEKYGEGYVKLGYGVCGIEDKDFHTDIEYYYEVIVNNNNDVFTPNKEAIVKIYETNGNQTKTKFKLLKKRKLSKFTEKILRGLD